MNPAPPAHTPSKTPRTDAAAESIYDRGLTEWVPVELARQLELENTALLAALEAQERVDQAEAARIAHLNDDSPLPEGAAGDEWFVQMDKLTTEWERLTEEAKALRAAALAKATA